MKYLFIACVLVLLLSGCTSIAESSIEEQSDNVNSEQSFADDISTTKVERSEFNMVLSNQQQTALNYALNFISIPENYSLTQVFEGLQDEKEVIVFRYTKGENAQIGGEHFSFTVAANDNLLLGVMWMDKQFEKEAELPSKEETAKIAEEYLKNIDSDLFSKLQLQWIAPHDEIISIHDKEFTLTGMKYKCYIPAEKTYSWVVVGAGGKIMTFERGLVWDSELGQRGSESWIYDGWLEKRLGLK